MKKSKGGAKKEKRRNSLSRLIDVKIKEPHDWRGEILAQVRKIIKQADRLRVDTSTFGYRILEIDGAEIATEVVLLTEPSGLNGPRLRAYHRTRKMSLPLK